MDINEMNLSLNGCGYLGIYHVGVCACIKKYSPQVLKNKISGGSVGALVACAFLCDVPLDVCAKYVFDVSMKVRNGIFGPFSPDLNIMTVLYESMGAMLPADAHLLCNGRLHVSATHFKSGKNVLFNKFASRDELLRSLMCSCFIPVYCGYEPPTIKNEKYADAALSNNSPWLNKHTVTVAPFSGNSDICPENDGLFMRAFTLSNTSIGLSSKNMYMLFRVLFPAAPEIQKDICQQGYNDALRFLRDQGLIPCPCGKSEKPNHFNCKPPKDTMQSEISNEIENAIQDFNRCLGYRLFQYRSLQMLYYMNIPSIVTMKLGYLAISMVFQKVQQKASLNKQWYNFLKKLKGGLYWPTANYEMDNQQNNTNKKDQEIQTEPEEEEEEVTTLNNNFLIDKNLLMKDKTIMNNNLTTEKNLTLSTTNNDFNNYSSTLPVNTSNYLNAIPSL